MLRMISNHLKMPQRLLNGPLFLLRTFRYPIAFRFRLVIALTLYNSVLCLHLGNIQAGDLQTRMRQHPVLDFLIGSLALRRRYVHVIQVDADADVVVRALLGQRYDRLKWI